MVGSESFYSLTKLMCNSALCRAQKTDLLPQNHMPRARIVGRSKTQSTEEEVSPHRSVAKPKVSPTIEDCNDSRERGPATLSIPVTQSTSTSQPSEVCLEITRPVMKVEEPVMKVTALLESFHISLSLIALPAEILNEIDGYVSSCRTLAICSGLTAF